MMPSSLVSIASFKAFTTSSLKHVNNKIGNYVSKWKFICADIDNYNLKIWLMISTKYFGIPYIESQGHRAVASLTVPGGQEFHFPHFFLKFRSNFLIFPQTLHIFFLILALRVGDSPTREGPAHATAGTPHTLGTGQNLGLRITRDAKLAKRLEQGIYTLHYFAITGGNQFLSLSFLHELTSHTYTFMLSHGTYMHSNSNLCWSCQNSPWYNNLPHMWPSKWPLLQTGGTKTWPPYMTIKMATARSISQCSKSYPIPPFNFLGKRPTIKANTHTKKTFVIYKK